MVFLREVSKWRDLAAMERKIEPDSRWKEKSAEEKQMWVQKYVT